MSSNASSKAVEVLLDFVVMRDVHISARAIPQLRVIEIQVLMIVQIGCVW